jgi:phosphate starvation-inducible PhoH-like protein
VVTGDITQIDLPQSDRSGLVRVQDILHGVEGIAFVYLSDADVVRHQLVRRIIQAFENNDRSAREAEPAKPLEQPECD